MIPASFDYVRPESLPAALEALESSGDTAKPLAGGQSLIPLLRLRLAVPGLLVDLARLAELRGVRRDGGELVIGAMTRHAEVMADPLVREHAPLLALATAEVADPAIRHRGTLGGSLAHADPAGDLPAVMLALQATLVARGPAGERRIGAREFFADYLTTALAATEILTEIRVPILGAGWGVAYEKFQRTAQAWAIVAVAVAVQVSDGRIGAARIGLANMGATPLRATATEQALVGAPASPDGPGSALAEACALAADGTSPPSDLGGSADYRRHLARVLTRRALLGAAGTLGA